MRIGLLITCLVDGMFPDVAADTVTVLRRLGHEVEVPLAQSCCGQMHINTGYPARRYPWSDAMWRLSPDIPPW